MTNTPKAAGRGRKPKEPEYVYKVLWKDFSEENLIRLVNHCDEKIDRYFSELSQRIARLVKEEVRRLHTPTKRGKKTRGS